MGHLKCYMGGSRIRTAEGDVAIQTIKAGDQIVVVRDGREVLETAKWVGFAAIDLLNHAHIEDAAPIRFRPGAIAENQPVRDLFVSPEHCMIISGRCVSAKQLVNGGSIVSERDHAPFIYYHIELEKHGILLAENALSESYLDTNDHASFDNSSTPRQLFARFEPSENAARWETNGCAPLADADEVRAIWADLAARSVQIGFPIPVVTTVNDANIHIVADGVVIEPTSNRNSRYVFIVPAGVTSTSLASRFCIPSDKMQISNRDTRRLGVAVNWIAIRSDDAETILSADHPALRDGWYDVEGTGRSVFRWTNGAATIPWESIAGPAILTVCCSQASHYPLYDDKARLIA